MPAPAPPETVIPVGRAGRPVPIRHFRARPASTLREDHQVHLSHVADAFARACRGDLGARARAEIAVAMAPAQQWRWSDLLAALPDPYCGAPAAFEPLAGPGWVSLSLPLARALIDRLLGGPGVPTERRSPLTEVEAQVVHQLNQRLLGLLASALSPVAELRATAGRQATRLEIIKAAPGEHTVVLLDFTLTVGAATGTLRVGLPSEGLLAHLDAFSGHDSSPSPTASLAGALLDTPVDLAVAFRPAALTPQEILGLRVGDVIALPHPTNEPLTVWAGRQPYLAAHPGRRGNRLAFAVVDPTGEPE